MGMDRRIDVSLLTVCEIISPLSAERAYCLRSDETQKQNDEVPIKWKPCIGWNVQRTHRVLPKILATRRLWVKIVHANVLAVSLPNAGRFEKFFDHHIKQQIYDKDPNTS